MVGGYSAEPPGARGVLVPARAIADRAPVSFADTVVSQDAAAGRITFRATAAIVDHRDAVPVSNELVSVPGTVS